MRVLSVCSGIGTDAVAWHPLGWEHLCFAEIEKFPSAVLKHRWPGVPNEGDFTKIGDKYRGAADLVVGGTPCQSFSVAGKRAGLDDARGNLTLEFARLAARIRPRWLVWENVPGVLSIDEGRTFGTFLGILGQLGYGFAYRVLDAQHFGVPQRRRRVFVVGHLGDWQRAAAVLFERHCLQGHHPPSREKGEGIAPTISARTKGDGGLGTDFDCNGGLVDVSGAVSSKWAKGTGGPAGADGFDASEDGTGRGTPLVPTIAPCITGNYGKQPDNSDTSAGPMLVAYRTAGDGAVFEEGDLTAPLTTQTDPSAHVIAFSAGQSSKAGSLAAREEQSPTLRGAASGTNQVPAVAFAQNTRDEVREMPYAGALAAEPGAKQQSYIRSGMAVRRLTPRECERLQGLPDGYSAIPVYSVNRKGEQRQRWRKVDEQEASYLDAQGIEVSKRGRAQRWYANVAPDGPRYKAIGNGMAMPVLRWIGERIQAVEEALSVRQANE